MKYTRQDVDIKLTIERRSPGTFMSWIRLRTAIYTLRILELLGVVFKTEIEFHSWEEREAPEPLFDRTVKRVVRPVKRFFRRVVRATRAFFSKE